jgi:hypothetical protein
MELVLACVVILVVVQIVCFPAEVQLHRLPPHRVRTIVWLPQIRLHSFCAASASPAA